MGEVEERDKFCGSHAFPRKRRGRRRRKKRRRGRGTVYVYIEVTLSVACMNLFYN
jgi:hypothetical protein